MAVYTHLTDKEVQQFLDAYDVGELETFSGIAEGVENSNFLLKTSRNQYILTLYEKRVNPTDIPFFLGLLTHLSDNGLSCPIPVMGKDGNALRTLGGKPAAVVTFLDGVWPKEIHQYHCQELGSTMAEMHKFSSKFSQERNNSLTLKNWRPLLEACQLTDQEIYTNLYTELNRELKWLEDKWPTELPKGIIHADLFPDNVFFKGPNLSGIIDFYFACTDFLVYDLAICINAWCFDDNEVFDIQKSQSMITAYQKVRPLSNPEIDALPILIRGSAIRFLLTRLYDWLNHPKDALGKPKDPISYLKKLRFHQTISEPSKYGVSK